MYIWFFRILVIVIRVADHLPQPCPKSTPNYNECMSRFLSKIGVRALKGIRELNIPPFSPFYLPAYSANRTISEIASAAGTVKNAKAYGFETVEIKNFKFDVDTLTGEIDIFLPYVRGTAEYEGSFKLLTPITLSSSGYSKAYAENVFVHLRFTLKPIERLGVKYYTFDKYKGTVNVGDGHIELLEKDPQEEIVAQFVTNFVNDNFKLTVDTFQELIDEVVEAVTKLIFEQVLHTIPANELIPE